MSVLQVARPCFWLLILGACNGGKDADSAGPADGSISLSWTVGSSGCEEAGVETVAVLISTVDPMTELGSFPCSSLSGALDVAPGTYDLAIRGRDSNGIDRYGGAADAVVVTEAGSVALGNILLSSLPATLSVNWVFDNGMLCAQNLASTIVVNLFDSGDFLAQTADASCNDGTAVLANVNGGLWTVALQGKDDAGNVGWEGSADVTVEAGVPATVTVTLAAP